ncbi:MAG: hypothetical protein QQW96_13520 [Tychonema bourrellyi B0820]|nr:hypothetical protein [Tychonema bourrellyi B0820]
MLSNKVEGRRKKEEGRSNIKSGNIGIDITPQSGHGSAVSSVSCIAQGEN